MMTYVFRRAVPKELTEVCCLIEQRIGWMDDVGIRQWNVLDYWDVFPRTYYEEQLRMGRMYVLERATDGGIAGAVVLREQDDLWPEYRGIPAYYIHHLVTDTRDGGAGRRMLDEIQCLAEAEGKRMLCLDCAADNVRLNEYYAQQGYESSGQRTVGNYTCIRRKKDMSLTARSSDAPAIATARPAPDR